MSCQKVIFNHNKEVAMIETGIQAWMLLVLVSALSIFVAKAISDIVPWSPLARNSNVPLAVAFSLSPFLLGFSSIAALGLFPGNSHKNHLIIVIVLLFGIFFGARLLRRIFFIRLLDKVSEPMLRSHRVFLWVLGLWVVGLTVDTLFIPLTQNDALEYASVGRILFETRDLASYPVLDSATNASGFYGPWTHPPLYVALIYLTNIVQGHADTPGLMRVIAPWFAFATVGLVYALGNMFNRLTGLISAVACISAPLFFLGADSALIDALPTLGFLLVITTIVATSCQGWVKGVIIGAMLGMSLWTHSQAVLFVPLTLGAISLWQYRSVSWRQYIDVCIVILLMAAIFGGWPYLRNLAIFGSPISDNPIIFALPSLAWSDYFTTGRGLDNWTAIIQYGWFKGWFALEAFGLVFWLALPGLMLCATSKGRNKIVNSGLLASQDIVNARILLIVWGVLTSYFIGVIFSTLIGLELMIKNERYLLVMLPLVSLMAGVGISRIVMSKSKRTTILLRCIVSLFVIQVLALVILRFVANGITPLNIGQPFQQTLENRSEFLVVDYLRNYTPDDILVLSIKPADMYYAQRKMISYLDPRLVPFYEEIEPEAALQLLRKLGVSYVHLPDYGLPPLYNSTLQTILRRPEWAELVYSADGSQIYKLVHHEKASEEVRDITPSDSFPWKQFRALRLGGRKGKPVINWGARLFNGSSASIGGVFFDFMHRDFITVLVAGKSLSSGGPIITQGISVNGGSKYGIDLTVTGNGLISIWIEQYDIDGELLRDKFSRSSFIVRIGEFVLGKIYKNQNFSRQIETLPDARSIDIRIDHVGSSSVNINRASISKL